MGVDAKVQGWKTNRKKLVRKVTKNKEKLTLLSFGLLLQIEMEKASSQNKWYKVN